VVATMPLILRSMPSDCSQSASGPDNSASPKMPFSKVIEVMPIWMVERKRVGCPARLTAAAASRSPW
jgi:hypothetical protein